MAQKTGDEMLLFHYDENGSPLGFQYRNSTHASGVFEEYIYGKNLQGDIVAIYNNAGTKLLSYKYDAWGVVSRIYAYGGSGTNADKNPLRYRGYYYDTDLAMYYLQSRYYDPAIGRFINADSALYHNILGYNMYAYCYNNPVNYIDHAGESAEGILQAWVRSGWIFIASDGGFPVGDLIYVGGVLVLGIACGVGLLYNKKKKPEAKPTPEQQGENSDDKNTSETETSKPTSPGKMQMEVNRNQAPKSIKQVHGPHKSPNSQPHIHFRDRTSMNQDGTIHDAHHGTPRLTNEVIEWLGKHNWATEIILFP